MIQFIYWIDLKQRLPSFEISFFSSVDYKDLIKMLKSIVDLERDLSYIKLTSTKLINWSYLLVSLASKEFQASN